MVPGQAKGRVVPKRSVLLFHRVLFFPALVLLIYVINALAWVSVCVDALHAGCVHVMYRMFHPSHVSSVSFWAGSRLI